MEGGAGLGPSLPLPLIRQVGKTESTIVEQPTNLRLLVRTALQSHCLPS